MKYIREYIDFVRNSPYSEANEQFLLCDLVERAFDEEPIYVDENKVEKYFALQKYFPYRLFEWEQFCFVLHNCVYISPGVLRWPSLVIFIGRGGGKNGYLAFENFCLLTPVNGIKNFHIDTYAMSEDQAKTSWSDLYAILEDNAKVMKKHFYWNKEIIQNIKTGSIYRFRTSRAESKDGGRPGKNDFDELHAYPNMKLIDVATTGGGKVAEYRETIITTDGDEVRGGPLDDLIEKCLDILNGRRPDNGTLPFICWLNDRDEFGPEHWHEANPSLRYMPNLYRKMEGEYADYLADPAQHRSFMTKRMNRHSEVTEQNITSRENILACSIDFPVDMLRGLPCVLGFDYASTCDMISACLLYRYEGIDYVLSHSWICRQSADFNRIKAPLLDWQAKGLLTIVDAPEIPATLPVWWAINTAEDMGSSILAVGIDKYRWQMMSKALEDASESSNNNQRFDPDPKTGNIKMCRPSDEMQISPVITSKFANHNFRFGDNDLMCWAIWNTKLEVSKAGNITYGKIEPRSRKTDPFKALVEAEIVSIVLDDANDFNLDETFDSITEDGVFVF